MQGYLAGRNSLTEEQLRQANVAPPCGPPHDRTTLNVRDFQDLFRASLGQLEFFACHPKDSLQDAASSASSASLPASFRSPSFPSAPITPRLLQLQRGVAFLPERQVRRFEVRVWDLSGRRVFQAQSNGSPLLWSWKGIGAGPANGVYLVVLRVEKADGTIHREIRKIVVVR